MDRDDEEMLELEAPRPANTSTSHTLVLSEEPRVALESSAPTHLAPEALALARSPRALKKKKARTGAAGKEEIATGSLLTPLLDDVRYPFLSSYSLCTRKFANFLILYFYLLTILQPLMKEMADIGSRFIGFHDEAESLRGKFFIAHNTLYVFACLIP